MSWAESLATGQTVVLAAFLVLRFGNEGTALRFSAARIVAVTETTCSYTLPNRPLA